MECSHASFLPWALKPDTVCESACAQHRDRERIGVAEYQ